MDIRQEILKKYEEFATFLEKIQLNDLKEQFTREELKEFEKKLREINVRSIPFEISKLIDQMKKEEYPELLGVHHYPQLREIDFMSEPKKIELDKHLVMIRKGNYVFNLFRFTKDTNRLKAFLLEKGIIKKVYHLCCPYHTNEKITGKYTLEEVEEVKKAVINKDDNFLAEFYDGLFCPTCEDGVEYKNWDDRFVSESYILVKERDESLDKA